MKRIILLFFCFTLVGCAAKRPDLTREQWLDMTSHTFKNTNVNNVLKAGEKVLRLADPSDVTIYHLPNKMVGSRNYFVFAVIAAVSGNYLFELTAAQKESSVETQLIISHSAQPITAAMTYTPGAGAGVTAVPGMVSNRPPMDYKEQYDLFYSRMESLLYSKPWIVCDEATQGKPTVALESMCILADDNMPEGIALSPKSSGIVASKNDATAKRRAKFD